MENILMRFCREKRRYTIKTIAYKLRISIEAYAEIEKGETLLTYEQAERKPLTRPIDGFR